jgi:ribonuclease VapC
MIVDASALIAILRFEPEESLFSGAMADAPSLRMSPVNWFEAAMNAEKEGAGDFAALEKLAKHLDLKIVPVDEAQMRIAHQAWLRYGKGKHPARLNLGDCFAYALAKQMDEPLLYKGGDFARTDIVSAV